MIINIPSSQGGLNLKDSLDAMESKYAFQMDNIEPAEGKDVLRQGCVRVGNDEAVKLIAFNKAGYETLITATDSSLYKLNTDKSRTLLKSGFASSAWQSTDFTDGSGNTNTIIANGSSDYVQRIYVDSGNITVGNSFTTAGLSSPLGYKNRIYLIEEGTFNIKYGGLNAISGSLTDYPTAGLFKYGGKLLTLENWTQDAGTGMQNLFTAFSSNGEVAVFSGTSPEADDWALMGVFLISKPIGKNCTCRMGGDLIIITQSGYLPLSQVLSQYRANITPISDKINPIVYGKLYTGKWSIVWYPKRAWILVNAPSTATGYAYEQHILNTKTGGWFRAVGWDALSWVLLGDDLYFSNYSGVFKADEGNTDNGKPITYAVQKAYSDLGIPNIKQVLMVKERTNIQGTVSVGTKLGIDFVLQDSTSKQISLGGNQSYWDEAIWDKSFWSSENPITQTKTPLMSKYGNFISVGLLGQSSSPLEFYATEANIKLGKGAVW